MDLKFSKKIGRFTLDSRIFAWLIGLALAYAGWTFLEANPQHNPLSPLNVNNPPGVATSSKLLAVTENRGECRAALARSGVEFRQLRAIGEGPCALLDRTQLTDAVLAPAAPTMTCPVAAGLEIWVRNGLQTAAQQHLGATVTGINHIGTVSCRRMNNSRKGPWSEHARGNAVDIRSFRLSDGRLIDVESDWGQGDRGEFLKAARNAACDSFRTVLSPDYNASHSNHFHLDQGTRWASVCR
ncbi:MAG: extensin family protein [Erythrobacter sp.]